MITEEWRPVIGYESIYDVSDHGCIRRIKKASGAVTGRILRPGIDRKGYLLAYLYKAGERRTFRIHRLVGAAFNGACPSGKQMNHIDGNKGNNRPANLEYVTASENIRHAFRIGLREPMRGEEHPGSKLTENDIHAIRDLLGIESQVVIAKRFGISQPLISLIAIGRKWAWLKEAT